jgi:hypothetical protein
MGQLDGDHHPFPVVARLGRSDATTVGVAFAGLKARRTPCRPSSVSRLPARPDAMMVGGVFTASPACTYSPKDGLPVCQADAAQARSVKSDRRRLAVCGHDADPLEERRRG